jgi:hypothetical protein
MPSVFNGLPREAAQVATLGRYSFFQARPSGVEPALHAGGL